MLIHDPKLFKLGRAPAKRDTRNLKFASYLTHLPAIPQSADWGERVFEKWGMMLNDKYGDCTCAAVGHAIQTFTANASTIFTAPDDAVQGLYVTVTGQEGGAFDPATGANDNGCAISDVLKEYRKNGLAGHKLGAYVEVAPSNMDHIRAAIALFGVVNFGVSLPISAQSQEVWDVPAGQKLTGDWVPGSWGGHSIIGIRYELSSKRFWVVTWGAEKQVTAAWLLAYCDEIYALLAQDWISGNKKSPSGFDLPALQKDMSALG